MSFSDRAVAMPVSPIRRLIPFADDARKRGIKILHLNIGDPDIKTPQSMIDFLQNWKTNPIPYSHSKGQKELLDSLIWYYQKLGFPLTSENIQTTVGGSEAIIWAFLTLCNPGDEVVVFEPFYANYLAFATISGVNLKAVPTCLETGFHLPKRAEIEKYITPKTKAILMCNPNNPTGTLYAPEELQTLAEIAQTHNLFILSDEVYREFAYDGKQQTSFLTYATDKLKERVVILDSLSKRYSVCGIRVGAFISYNTELLQTVLKLGQARLSAGFIDQMVASQLTNVPDSYFEMNRSEYEARRNVMVDGLNAIPGVSAPMPEGAFYMMVKLPVPDAGEFAKWLLTDFSDNNETVMVAPGDGFYQNKEKGKSEVRIAYVINQTDLKRSVELLGKALYQYSSR